MIDFVILLVLKEWGYVVEINRLGTYRATGYYVSLISHWGMDGRLDIYNYKVASILIKSISSIYKQIIVALNAVEMFDIDLDNYEFLLESLNPGMQWIVAKQISSTTRLCVCWSYTLPTIKIRMTTSTEAQLKTAKSVKIKTPHS